MSSLNMQCAALTSDLEGTLASKIADPTGMFNPRTSFSSCSASQSCGCHVSSEPVFMANCPQNLELHVIEVSIP